MNPDDLNSQLRRWLQENDSAQAAADLLLKHAAAKGTLPNQFKISADDPACPGLMHLFSARYFKPAADGQCMVLHVQRWAQQVANDPLTLLQALATCTGQPLTNRRQHRIDRQVLLDRLLEPATTQGGLCASVALCERENIQRQRGRIWSRTRGRSPSQIEREIGRYLRLLSEVDLLLAEPDRMIRLVHLSRLAAGDSHYLRPGNQICRDLAADLAIYRSSINGETHGNLPAWDQVLAETGIVENLISINVLLYGRLLLHHDSATWHWPLEAATAHMPLWLSAAQLERVSISAASPVRSVITVENETSMLDLIDQQGDDSQLVLVCTAGQANRAVIRLLSMLHKVFPAAMFEHQGDLDLPGVHILQSLRERTQIDIHPSQMDAQTFARYEKNHGITLSKEEQTALNVALRVGELPCSDLLRAIHHAGKRIEQESITHNPEI